MSGESINVDAFGVSKPQDSQKLYRYMDKWKYESLLTDGLAFTNAMLQEDKNDCRNHHIEDGYVKACNALRKYMLISCWTMDDFNEENVNNKFNEYCSFKDKDGIKDCNVGYIVETTVKKLNDFINRKCLINNVFTSLKTYIKYCIRTGIVKYVDTKSFNNIKCSKADVFPFEKDKEYELENEYRLFLQRSGLFVYDDKLKCLVLKTNDCPFVDFMQGNPKDIITNVYIYDKTLNSLSETDVPIVSIETLEPSLIKPSKAY